MGGTKGASTDMAFDYLPPEMHESTDLCAAVPSAAVGVPEQRIALSLATAAHTAVMASAECCFDARCGGNRFYS